MLEQIYKNPTIRKISDNRFVNNRWVRKFAYGDSVAAIMCADFYISSYAADAQFGVYNNFDLAVGVIDLVIGVPILYKILKRKYQEQKSRPVNQINQRGPDSRTTS